MKKFFCELFSEGDKSSMMRFGALIVLAITSLFSLVIAGIIITLAIKCSELLDSMNFWGGISMFIGTLLLNTGIFFGVKAYQKKYENSSIGLVKSTNNPSSIDNNSKRME